MILKLWLFDSQRQMIAGCDVSPVLWCMTDHKNWKSYLHELCLLFLFVSITCSYFFSSFSQWARRCCFCWAFFDWRNSHIVTSAKNSIIYRAADGLFLIQLVRSVGEESPNIASTSSANWGLVTLCDLWDVCVKGSSVAAIRRGAVVNVCGKTGYCPTLLWSISLIWV